MHMYKNEIFPNLVQIRIAEATHRNRTVVYISQPRVVQQELLIIIVIPWTLMSEICQEWATPLLIGGHWSMHILYLYVIDTYIFCVEEIYFIFLQKTYMYIYLPTPVM